MACGLWQPVAILTDLADCVSSNKTSDHMRVLIHTWNRSRAKNQSLFQVLSNTALLYNKKFLTALIKKVFLKLLLLRTILTDTLMPTK